MGNIDRILLAAVLIVATALLGLAPAHASATGNATGDGVTTAASACYWHFKADGVHIRTGPGTGYTSVGLGYRGQEYRAQYSSCSIVVGYAYTACGGTNNAWAAFYYKGVVRYSAARCMAAHTHYY